MRELGLLFIWQPITLGGEKICGYFTYLDILNSHECKKKSIARNFKCVRSKSEYRDLFIFFLYCHCHTYIDMYKNQEICFTFLRKKSI